MQVKVLIKLVGTFAMLSSLRTHDLPSNSRVGTARSHSVHPPQVCTSGERHTIAEHLYAEINYPNLQLTRRLHELHTGSSPCYTRTHQPAHRRMITGCSKALLSTPKACREHAESTYGKSYFK